MRVARLLLFVSAASLPLAAIAAAPDAAHAAFDQAIEQAKTAMMADPQAALGKSDAALLRAATLPGKDAAVGRATALWLKAEALIGLNRLSDAQALADEAIVLVERNAPDTKLHGDLMRSRGSIAGLRGRMQDSLRDLLAAYRIFRVADVPRSQAIVLQDIGQMYWEAGDYERMLRYHVQARELYDDDPALALAGHNNTGEALRTLGRGAEAAREYEAALGNARQLGSVLLEARILGNLALVEIDMGRLAAASRNAARALELTRSAEAAEWRPMILGVMARVAAARGDDAVAAAYLQQAFAGMDLARTDAAFREYHQLAAQVFQRVGQPQLALAHLTAYQRLDSEARNLTANASSQLLSAQFDFANQNLRISQLQQERLRKDVQLERQRVSFRTTLFTVLGTAGVTLLALLVWAFLSIRRSRNEVRAANTVLTRVNGELEGALKAKTDFLAMTSHEIRTPLNGILGMTQVMLASPALAGETREQVQLVHGAGETMKALVDDILDVAKMETSEVSVTLVPTRLQPILDDAVALWRARAEAKGLVLETALDCPQGPIAMDGGKLRQILFNLLSNAIKFTPAGTVRVELACGPGDSFTLAVEDTGIGIAVADHAHVFEAFHQVDSAMTRQFSGTGLGLTICRNLAAALGGSIALTSQVGEGSRFVVTLPLHPIDDPAALRPHSLATARLAIVEAGAERRDKIAALLAPHCAAVLPLADGAAALDAIAAGSVDGLLIDSASAGAALPALLAADVSCVLLVAADEEAPAACEAVVLRKPVKGGELMGALRGLFAAPLAQAA